MGSTRRLCCVRRRSWRRRRRESHGARKAATSFTTRRCSRLRGAAAAVRHGCSAAVGVGCGARRRLEIPPLPLRVTLARFFSLRSNGIGRNYGHYISRKMVCQASICSRFRGAPCRHGASLACSNPEGRRHEATRRAEACASRACGGSPAVAVGASPPISPQTPSTRASPAAGASVGSGIGAARGPRDSGIGCRIQVLLFAVDPKAAVPRPLLQSLSQLYLLPTCGYHVCERPSRLLPTWLVTSVAGAGACFRKSACLIRLPRASVRGRASPSLASRSRSVVCTLASDVIGRALISRVHLRMSSCAHPCFAPFSPLRHSPPVVLRRKHDLRAACVDRQLNC